MMDAQQGRAEDAIRDFQQSLQLRPDYAIALLNLGNVYRRQGSLEKAQESLSKRSHFSRTIQKRTTALECSTSSESDATRDEYLQKSNRTPAGLPEAMNNLGILLVRQQDYAQAEEQFKTCIRLGPGFDQSYMNLARLYAMQDDKDKAREVLQELLRVQPQNAAAKQAMEMLE